MIARERLGASRAIDGLRWVERQITERLERLDLAEVPALRLYADICRWKIERVLPPLKPVDLESGSSDTVIRISVGGDARD